MVRVCRCLFSFLFFPNVIFPQILIQVPVKWASWLHSRRRKRLSPNVKMKMNEEEGPGEEDDTRGLVKSTSFSGGVSGQHADTPHEKSSSMSTV